MFSCLISLQLYADGPNGDALTRLCGFNSAQSLSTFLDQNAGGAERVVAPVQQAACQNERFANQVDGLTLNFSGGVRLGPAGFSGQAECALFYDRANRTLRGQVFFIPEFSLGAPSTSVSVKVGATWGCEGNPDNYSGYFASGTVGGATVSVGVGDGIFNRIGAALAGGSIDGTPGTSFLQANDAIRNSSLRVNRALASLGNVPRGDVCFARLGPFDTVEERGGEVAQVFRPFVDSLRDFVDHENRVSDGVADLMNSAFSFREQLSRPGVLPHTLSSPLAQLSQQFENNIWGTARFAPRVAQNNAALNLRLNQLDPRCTARVAQLRELIAASQERARAYRSQMQIIQNDAVAQRQGQPFNSDRRVGSRQDFSRSERQNFSGCNAVSMDPASFNRSGASLLAAVAGISIAANAQNAGLADLGRLIGAAGVGSVGGNLTTPAGRQGASVNLSYYYTPEDLERRLGIPVASGIGTGRFDFPAPEWMNRALGNPRAACGERHDGGGNARDNAAH